MVLSVGSSVIDYWNSQPKKELSALTSRLLTLSMHMQEGYSTHFCQSVSHSVSQSVIQ